MNSDQFAIWLDGFLAAAGKALSAEQMAVVQAKLATVSAAPAAPTPVPQFIPVPYAVPYTERHQRPWRDIVRPQPYWLGDKIQFTACQHRAGYLADGITS